MQITCLVAGITAALLLACGSSQPGFFPDSQREWSARVSHLVPPGSPADSAVTLLTRMGMSCDPVPTDPEALVCQHRDKGMIVIQQWRVMLDTANGTVRKAEGSYGLIGP